MTKIFFASVFLFNPLFLHAQNPPWRLAEGSNSVAIADIDIFLNNPDTMYAIGDQFLRSTDGGEHWEPILGPATDLGALRCAAFDSRIIYVSHYGLDPSSNDISMTTDGGMTWQREFIGRGMVVPIVELDPVDLHSVYVGVGPGMIFRTSDDGQTWELLAGPPTFGLIDLAIAPSQGDILLTGNRVEIFKSADRGETWAELSVGIPFELGGSFAIDPVDPDVMYAALASFGPMPGGVYKSTDGGVTWFERNNGLGSDDWIFLTIEINPLDGQEIFLGVSSVTRRGLMRSTNGGDSWEQFTDGLPDSTGVRSIAFERQSGKVVISVGGLYSNGIYLLDPQTMDVGSPISTSQVESNQLQAFPNPFNPATEISFTIPAGTRPARTDLTGGRVVSLRIYDVLGREAATLVNGDLEQGQHRRLFDGSRLSSGVYFARLEAGTHVQSIRLIHLK